MIQKYKSAVNGFFDGDDASQVGNLFDSGAEIDGMSVEEFMGVLQKASANLGTMLA